MMTQKSARTSNLMIEILGNKFFVK